MGVRTIPIRLRLRNGAVSDQPEGGVEAAEDWPGSSRPRAACLGGTCPGASPTTAILRGRPRPGQALRPQEGRRRDLRRDRQAHRHAELQRGGHRQSRPRPGRGHPLEPLGREGPDPADPRRDHRAARPVRGRQPPPRRPRHGQRSLPRGLRRQRRGDLLGEDPRVAGEARHAAAEGVARRPARSRSPTSAPGWRRARTSPSAPPSRRTSRDSRRIRRR